MASTIDQAQSPAVRLARFDQAAGACAAGDHDGARRIVQASLDAGTGGIDWVRFALQCRDRGQAATAEALLVIVRAIEPGVGAAAYELAFLHRLRGDHRAAVRLLRQAPQQDSARIQLFLAHMLYAMGAQDEAGAILDRLRPADAGDRAALDAMVAFGQYLARHPLGRALVMLDEIKQRHGWLDTADVAERIEAAQRAGRPFALVRLGDGEGGMLSLGQLDEARHRALYDRNRNQLAAMWFGEAFDWRRDFLALGSDLLSELAACDVLGVPYESWLRHEYAISSLRGVPSLVNVYRALLARPASRAQQVCSQHVHIDLHDSGHLERIIRQAKRISVVCCLPDIAPLLRQRFALEEVTVYRIPGEQGSKALLGDDAVGGIHYPDAFRQMRADLARPHAGRLFLVAGGILGKLYAATIRQHGGIVLDIGSLADAWTGRATRPGYDQRLALTGDAAGTPATGPACCVAGSPDEVSAI